MMRITFISNFLNHHQLILSKELTSLTLGEYTFVATEPIPQNRKDMGYEDMNDKYDFTLCAYKGKDEDEEAQRLGDESDVVIIGSASEKYIQNRLKKGKLTFYYSERIFKSGNPSFFTVLKMSISHWRHYGRYNNKPFYLLCASAYAAADYNMLKCFLGKTLKWGYFPEVHEYNIKSLLNSKKTNNRISILWVGRVIDWKHPEAAVEVAKFLKKNNYNFSMEIIGIGNCLDLIKEKINKYDLEQCVTLVGALSPTEVRKHMELANIFLFTSDFNEGWGAVLNEAMNSACAVVASHGIGAVPFLIKDTVNGMIYESGNQDQLNNIVKKLMDNYDYIEHLGKEAYITMQDEWNAKEAATRLVRISENLLANNEELYETGPCSMAYKLDNGWYKNEK